MIAVISTVLLGFASGKCLFDFPAGRTIPNRVPAGCGINQALSRQPVPCVLDEPTDPVPLGRFGDQRLKNLCPAFYEKYKDADFCCSDAQVSSLQDKFDSMFGDDPILGNLNDLPQQLKDAIKAALQQQFPDLQLPDQLPDTNITLGLFHNCPACRQSQQEYYCNMYCSPVQDQFVTVVDTFETEIDGVNKTGLAEFVADLPKSYTDALYASCQNVKQEWFKNQQVSDLIPTITTNIIEQRWCKGERNCDGVKWLSGQGTTTTGWPRSGILNTVANQENKENLESLVTPCEQNNECGCFNCLQSCEKPERLDLTKPEYEMVRGENMCGLKPNCGKNLLIPNGAGLTRNDIPCLVDKVNHPEGRPATVLRHDTTESDELALLDKVRQTCPAYLNNHPDGTAICCEFDQIRDLSEETAQVRQLFGRCPSCLKTMEMVYCHTTCHKDQSLFMRPIYGFETINSRDNKTAIGIDRIDFFWTEELMDGIWNACKDVVFTQTNGKVIEDLMCDGNKGADCTVERFLNFNGGTSNGFSPYDLVYVKVTKDEEKGRRLMDQVLRPDSELRTFLSREELILTEFSMTEEEVTDLEPELVPLARENFVFDCDQEWVDPGDPSVSEPACSCTDCETACPALGSYPEPEERATIGTGLDMWIFVAIMTSVGLVVLFVLFVVLRKVCKSSSSKIDGIHSVTTSAEPQKMVLPEDVGFWDKLSHRTQSAFSSAFYWWAKKVVCRFPLITIFISLAWSIPLIIGMGYVEFTTDPIRLWSSPESRSFKEYEKFNEKFVPFYRASQIIAVLRDEYKGEPDIFYDTFGEPYEFNRIMDRSMWRELYDLSIEARELVATCSECEEKDVKVEWKDVCFNPLSDEDDETAGGCSLFSVFQYWQNNFTAIADNHTYVDREGNDFETDYRNHILYCTRTPSALTDKYFGDQPCGSDFGSPVFPFLATGGYDAEEENYWGGEALIVSFINNNVENKNSDQFKKVEAWESAFLSLLKDVTENNKLKYFDVAFFSERSIEDEIDATTESDLGIFVASYVIIFVYIMSALGSYSSLRRVPVDMKVSLAFGGIVMILVSALAATGVFGWAEVASNLIVMEVVPFLLLAIGADNVFILVMDIQREERKKDEGVDDVIARVLAKSGPSMLLCALTESTVFFIGSVTDMPAVKVFALNAGLAIIFNFVLQVTAFLALIKLDMMRLEANRFDIVYCVKSKHPPPSEKKVSLVQRFFSDYYTPILMNDLVGFGVIACFFAWFGASIYFISIATIGLDQNVSVPLDSYVSKYFEFMESFLMVGVPVYFVMEGKFDYQEESSRNLVCSYAGCDLFSLAEQVSRAAKQPKESMIVTSATVWVDDYMDWIDPSTKCCFKRNCCPVLPWPIEEDNFTFKKYLTGRDEQEDDNCYDVQENGQCEFCSASDNQKAPGFGRDACLSCFPRTLDGQTNVTEADFLDHIDFFLKDNPDEYCSKGGHASYGDALNIVRQEDGAPEYVESSYFMAYHRVCIKSAECQENLEAARYLANNITEHINGELKKMGKPEVEIWPYSIYYPYYEQYITMAEDAIVQIAICLVPAFLLTFILLGFDLISGLIVIMNVTMIVVDTYGMCSIWGVDFNALTLINLIAAIGLSIEFTGHTVRTFALSTKTTRKERVMETMTTMGPAVMLGVAFTNLPGIICLHWAQAQIIEIFFFRMNFVTTLVGIAHGLIFVPVFLAYFGPNINKARLLEQQDQQVENMSRPGEVIDAKDKIEMKSEKVDADNKSPDETEF